MKTKFYILIFIVIAMAVYPDAVSAQSEMDIKRARYYERYGCHPSKTCHNALQGWGNKGIAGDMFYVTDGTMNMLGITPVHGRNTVANNWQPPRYTPQRQGNVAADFQQTQYTPQQVLDPCIKVGSGIFINGVEILEPVDPIGCARQNKPAPSVQQFDIAQPLPIAESLPIAENLPEAQQQAIVIVVTATPMPASEVEATQQSGEGWGWGWLIVAAVVIGAIAIVRNLFSGEGRRQVDSRIASGA